MTQISNHTLIDTLATQITPERFARMQQVLAQRTRHLAVGLEDIFQGHNAAAVLRSCECFGVQEVHCIESRNKFKPNDEVSMGAAKWLDINHYATTEECLTSLKASGHQIVAMTLAAPSIPLAEIPLDKPTVLLFGTEEQGLSATAHELADIRAYIPMVGFTQSFNISVSVAVSLQTLFHRLHAMPNWKLATAEEEALLLKWLKLTVPHWEALQRRN
jgi:tRNA (guanosine-2'-O-)-methyltransferase